MRIASSRSRRARSMLAGHPEQRRPGQQATWQVVLLRSLPQAVHRPVELFLGLAMLAERQRRPAQGEVIQGNVEQPVLGHHPV